MLKARRWKWIGLLSVVMISQGAAFAEPSTNQSDSEYLVKVSSRRSNARGEVISLLSQSGIKVKDEIPQISLLVVRAKRADMDRFTADRSKMQDIEYVESNLKVSLFPDESPSSEIATFSKKPNDNLGIPSGIKNARAPEAWEVTTGDPSVVVAVSDTGIWPIHPDLEANIWHNPGETGKDAAGKDKAKNRKDDDGDGFVDDTWGWNFDGRSNNPRDEHGHGTHVAGTIGAIGNNKVGLVGMNWKVSIMSVRFLSSTGSGTTENGIRTLIYAADHGAKAVNCSWGGDGYTQSLYDAIDYAKSKGTIVVAAAGNDGENIDKHPSYPAAYANENLITVGATQKGSHRLTGFTNYGVQSVDLAAEGDSVLSTYLPMQPGHIDHHLYEVLSGTSMAAPHVTGALALMYAANPNLTWAKAKELLLANITPSASWKGKSVTGGVLNAEAAVKAARALR